MWWTRYHLTASCVDWFLLNQWLSPDFRALDTISAQSCKNDTLPSFVMLKLCYYKIRFWGSKFEESNNFIQQ